MHGEIGSLGLGGLFQTNLGIIGSGENPGITGIIGRTQVM